MERGHLLAEVLLTYGWAFLGVFVMIGTLTFYTGYYLRVAPQQCLIEAPFTCFEYRATQSGLVQLGIQSNVFGDIGPVEVMLRCDDREDLLQTAVLPVVRSKERFNGTLVYFNCSAVDRNPFPASISISYTHSGELVDHTSHGYVRLERES